MKKWIPIVMAAILMATMFASNVNAASTSHVRTISSDSADPSKDFKAFDTTLKAYDFNGDGRKEIIAHNDNRHVYVINPKSGNILAELKTSYPDGWGARPLNSPEAAILEKGGTPHIVIVNSASVVTLFRYDGAWGGEHHFTKVWDKRTTFCHKDPGNDAKPVLADLNGDGTMEILIQTEEKGIYALKASDGKVLWRRCIWGGNGEPAVADMNGNGVLDVVVASDGGTVTRLNGKTGATICSFWGGDPKYGLGAASMPVGPTIAQVNNKGPLDIVVGARDSSNSDQSKNHAALFAIKGKTCDLMWVAQDNQKGNPLTYTHPVVHDVDNDGRPDILWADWNTEGHKPGNWERTGPANFYRFDNQGNMVWRTTLDTYWNNKDLAVADVDNDGTMEILANGPGSGGDGIWYLNSKTGNKEQFISTHPWKVTRAPVIYDLYGWGTMQWIVPVEAATSGVSGGGIMIFDTGAPYNAAWPHPPAPGKASSGGSSGGGGGGDSGGDSGGDFDATFKVPDTTNNWWVETKVTANEPVSKVVARVDGEPTRLQKTDWGTWAKSFHVADGSEVRFVAHSNDGDKDRSKLHTWGSGGGSSGSGDFTASFTPTSNRGEWWVETSVDANKPLQKVEARHSDGSWKTLEKTDWGSYAKSFHVPEGSQVRFRATDGDTTVRSTWYNWT